MDSQSVIATANGLYCAEGDFYIDPMRPVQRAVITHAHSDHARGGHEHMLCSVSGVPLLLNRVGGAGTVQGQPFGEPLRIGNSTVTLYPAGHILGSAQVRIQTRFGTTVVTGDYNATHRHLAAEPFESVACDTFISECTFGLPIYVWPDPATVAASVLAWWHDNRNSGLTSIVYAYPLGKTQRLVHMLSEGPGPLAVLGNGVTFLDAYRAAGVPMSAVLTLNQQSVAEVKGKGLVIVSASIQNDQLLKQLSPYETAFASGWMAVRSARRQSGQGNGFVLSDHSDWPGLLKAIEQSGATRIGLVHGDVEAMGRYLRETGRFAWVGAPPRADQALN